MIAANIVPILSTRFNIEVNDFGDYISCACPVHEGDNPNAFTMNVEVDHPYFGLWKCWTQDCHEDCINTPVGLIRVLLSRTSEKSGV